LIDGFSELDEAVAGSVDVKLQPLMVLEDIKAGSIRVFLSSMLKKIDDEGLGGVDTYRIHKMMAARVMTAR
jgi:hypothetical protein